MSKISLAKYLKVINFYLFPLTSSIPPPFMDYAQNHHDFVMEM
ncbi:hypothetical protein [Turicimonas sp. TL08]